VAQAAPRARLEVIPDAAHLANLDNPQAFQQAVDRFLSGLGH
jgi:pimeloyl-ACP methyl ester carboxylesterase